MCIIIRHQGCAKARNQLHMNGINGHGNHTRTINEPTTTMLFPTATTNLTTNSAIDLHEIQTLMSKANESSLTAKVNGGANGIIKRCDNVSNGIVRSIGSADSHVAEESLRANDTHEYSLESSEEEDDDDDSDFDDYNEISCRNLISSTPKNKQQTQLPAKSSEYGSSSGLINLPVSITNQ